MLDDAELLEHPEIHFLEATNVVVHDDGNMNPVVQTLPRGSTLVVTDEILAASKNKNGDSWLALADEPDLQRLRRGRVWFGVGPFPADEESTHRDHLEDRHAAMSVGPKIYNSSQTIAKYRADHPSRFGPRDNPWT